MGSVLLVHPDWKWREKIKVQSKESASFRPLLCSSLLEAREVIGNALIPLDGIYLPVNDGRSSLFEFLEFCLTNRPVTPVFLLDQPDASFLKSIRIKGVFPQDTTFSTLVGALRASTPEEATDSEVRPIPSGVRSGFIAIPTLDFRSSRTYPADVFIHHQDGSMNLFSSKGSPVDRRYLEQAEKFSHWLYMSDLQHREAREEIRNAKLARYDLGGISEPWLKSELFAEARQVLGTIRKEMPTDPLIRRAHGFLYSLFRYLNRLDRSGNAPRMIEFLHEAAETDRALQSLTLSLLLCGHFRFEKTAIVEILGLACMLQDISLIHSPFGNISELLPDAIPPEAKNFYHRHPLHSADLLASSTTLGQTTLQVIRQHHETKDRKGFPNRIGGSQLHPMAEVLSMINQYLIIRDTASSPSEILDLLNRVVFPRYSQEMTRAMASVLLKTGKIDSF